MGLFVGRHVNKIDKKGRVSMPKPFRAVFQSRGETRFYAYPLFKHPAIEACGESFMARLSGSLDDLDMFSDEQDDLAAVVLENAHALAFDSEGRIVLAKEIASLYTMPKIVMDVKSSNVFFNEVKKFGCDPIMFKTGHSPIKEKMKEINSPLSGEMSGHVCYADDFYGYDDAMYVALRLLRILSNEKKSLNDLIAQYPETVSTPETRIDVEESRKFIIVKEIKERLKNFAGEIIDIDGIRLQNKKGWFLIRASNTQNQLTCRAEALNKADLVSLTNLIEEQLKLSNVNFKFSYE